jgi:hypothetical protein
LSSEDGDFCVILSECQSTIPTSGTLTLRVSPGADEIEIRSGSTFEGGRLVYRGHDQESYQLSLGDYAVRVRYVNGQDTVLAFDGGEIDYSTSKECEQTFYESDDLTLDLALSPDVWVK